MRRTSLLWGCLLALVPAINCTDEPLTRTQDGVTFDIDVPVTFSGMGVRPGLLHLYQGRSVTFVNDDTVPHVVSADIVRSRPAECAVISVGVLPPGQRRVSSDLPPFGECYFYDESRKEDRAFQVLVLAH